MSPTVKNIAVATFLIGSVSGSFGLGFRIPNQDAAAIARANAFVATADNPSAIYYNPAGLTQLEGVQTQIGAHILSVKSTYEGPGGFQSKTRTETAMVPQMYFSYSPEEKPYSFGLGMYVPYGLGLEWAERGSFDTLGIEGRLNYTTVSPQLAWQVTDTLSLGAGLTLNYSEVKLRQSIPLTPNGQFKFKGIDQDVGYILGALWQPHQQWSFGAKYRAATSMNYDGYSHAQPISGNEATQARLPFPQFVVGGVSYRPTPKWNFEVDIDWTDWDQLKTPIFDRSVSADVAFPFNWKSSFLYHFGVTRYLENDWWVSAGYFYSANSTTDTNFNPLVPDTNLHVGAMGVGRKGKTWDWAVSTEIITGPDRVVSGSNPSLFGQNADGRYHFLNYSVNFSLGYKF
ncbi:outer membrane protein transport protein [Verrucomicrobia bacterium]|nr:outer membrane protein transport protein [Verrucomicrobiota bacterium]